MPRNRTGSVITGKDGKLYARVTYTDEDGRKHNLVRRAKNEADAQRIITKLHKTVDESGHRGIEADKLRFSDLAETYRKRRLIAARYVGDGDNVRKIAGLRSLKSPLAVLKTLKGYFGNRLVRSIRHGDVEEYKLHRLDTPVVIKTKNEQGEMIETSRPRTIASVNRELELLRAIFNYAKREAFITRSPFELGAPLISKADETKRDRVLTFEEESRLLAAIDSGEFCERRSHLRPIIIAALDTAARRGELLKMEWRDVDLMSRVMTIRAANSKTALARVVPITPRLKVELEKLLQVNCEPTARVFGIVSDIKNSFATACRLAGIEGFRLHDCRHTAITRMIRAGVPVSEVMKISGHSQMATFLRYLNPTGDAIRSAADALARLTADAGLFTLIAVTPDDENQVVEMVN